MGIQPGGIDSPRAEPTRPVVIDVYDENQEEFGSAQEGKTPISDINSAPFPASVNKVTLEPQTTVKKPPQDLSGEKEAPNIKGQSLYVTFEGRAGPDPRNANQGQISIGLHRIIKAEGPMFSKRAYDIYLRGGGIQRMGGKLKRTMNKTLQYAINKELVEIEDELGKGGLIYSVVRNSKNCSSQSRTSQPGRNSP